MDNERRRKGIPKLKREVPFRAYTNNRVRNISVGNGLPLVVELQAEIDGYMDVLTGRVDAPVKGVTALMEVGEAYFTRAKEIDAKIKRGEADGTILKSSDYTKFRTGELRDFIDIAKGSAQLGSRRLSALSLEAEQAKTGRESSGGVG